MRIAVLTSSYPRFPGDGAAPFVQSLAETMAHSGHTVSVVAPFDPDVQPNISSSVKVHRFRYIWPYKWHLMGHSRSLESDTHLKLGSIFLLPFFLIGAIIKLMQVTHHEKTELIHVHWVLPNGPAATIAARLRRIPFVISLHGSDIYIARKKRHFGLVARWVFSNSSAVTACSHELRSAAIDLGAPQSTQLIAWGADPKIFTPKEKSMAIANPNITVVSLGRLVPKKGFDQLLLAWKDVILRYPRAHLIIGGEGPQKATLETQAKYLGIANSVLLPGRIPWDKVPDFLAAADIFVLPSQRDMHGNIDGLPTVLLEAMSCGVPVIASHIGGVPLVISDFQNGILFSPDNNSSLGDAIEALINNPKERERLGRAARQSIINEFNWEYVANKFIGVFKQALLKRASKHLRLGTVYREEIIRHLNIISKFGPILDIGCHDGYFLSHTESNLRVGVDLDPLPLFSNVEYVCADGCNLPFKPGFFTQVFALDVLEHVPNDADFARSIFKQLNLQGELILTTPSKNIIVTPRFLSGWIGKRWGHTQRTGYSPKNLFDLFTLDQNDIVFQAWNAPYYRFWYMAIRLLQIISPNFSIFIVRQIARIDCKFKNGHQGFYVIKVFPTE